MALVMLPSPSVAQLGPENAPQGDTGPLADSGLTPSPTFPSQRGFPRGEAPTLPRGEGQRTPVCYNSGHRKGRGGSLSGPSMPPLWDGVSVLSRAHMYVLLLCLPPSHCMSTQGHGTRVGPCPEKNSWLFTWRKTEKQFLIFCLLVFSVSKENRSWLLLQKND